MNGMVLYFTLLSDNGAVIDLRTSKYSGKNLVKGAGWVRLAGKNKKMKHPLRRIHVEGPLPPIRVVGDETMIKEVEMTETEFKEVIKILEGVWF